MWEDDVRRNIMELVQYQLNLALLNYDLSLNKASHLGLAALLNAIDSSSWNLSCNNSQEHVKVKDDIGSMSTLVQSQICTIMTASAGATVVNGDHLVTIRRRLCEEVCRQSPSKSSNNNEPARNYRTMILNGVAANQEMLLCWTIPIPIDEQQRSSQGLATKYQISCHTGSPRMVIDDYVTA